MVHQEGFCGEELHSRIRRKALGCKAYERGCVIKSTGMCIQLRLMIEAGKQEPPHILRVSTMNPDPSRVRVDEVTAELACFSETENTDEP